MSVPSSPAEARIRGAIDVVHLGWVVGWISDAQNAAVDYVECMVDGRYAGTSSQFFYRQDLLDLGLGNGVLGYKVAVPPELGDGHEHSVELHAFKDGERLGTITRKLLFPCSVPPSAEPPAPPLPVPQEPGDDERDQQGDVATPSTGPGEPRVRGAIDAIQLGSVVGWVSDAQNAAVDFVECTVDGRYAGTSSEFTFRQDLSDLGLGDGVLGYKVSIGPELGDGREHSVELHAFKDGEQLGTITKNMLVPRSGPVNTNPFLLLDAAGSAEGWSRVGSQRADFALSTEYGRAMPHGYQQYTRLVAQLDPAAPAPAGLSQKIGPEAATSGDLSLLLLGRSLSRTALRVRVHDSEGNDTLSERLPLSGTWTVYRVPCSSVRAKQTLCLELVGAGLGIVDLGCAALVCEPASRVAVPRPPKLQAGQEQAAAPLGQLRYRPNDWPNGLSFAAPETGSELARGWFFDCSKGQNAGFSARLVPGPESAPAAAPCYSLRARHTPLSGYSRICLPVDRGALLALDGATLQVELTSANRQELRPPGARLCVIGRSSRASEVLWQQQVNLPVAARRCVVSASVPPAGINEIRHQAIQFACLELALDFRANYEVTLHEFAVLAPEAPSAAPTSPPERYYEDQNVAAQADTLVDLPRFKALVAAEAREEPVQAELDVVVPIHDAVGDVQRCLDALVEANDGSYQLILVDDASGPRTARFLDRYAADKPAVRLLRHKENRGYTHSINAGVAQATAEHVVILNSDTIVPKGWHRLFLRVFEEFPKTGIAGPLSSAASWQSVPHRLSSTGTWLVNPVPGHLSVDDLQQWLERTWTPRYPELPLLNGFCQCLCRKVFDSVGAFDAATFSVGYGEENDLCLRAAAAGWELRVVDNLYVYHAKSCSFGNRRAELSRRGTQQLRAKYPNVDWAVLEVSLRGNPHLAAVREHIQRAGARGG